MNGTATPRTPLRPSFPDGVLAPWYFALHLLTLKMLPAFISVSLACVVVVQGQVQSPFQSHRSRTDYYELSDTIERVAVIGAGPAGLQQTAALLDAGFQVRMFERAPRPGGQWQYTDKTPISAPFPYVALSLR